MPQVHLLGSSGIDVVGHDVVGVVVSRAYLGQAGLVVLSRDVVGDADVVDVPAVAGLVVALCFSGYLGAVLS